MSEHGLTPMKTNARMKYDIGLTQPLANLWSDGSDVWILLGVLFC
jgi:hypothetical protein